jgi:hypothetical protein
MCSAEVITSSAKWLCCMRPATMISLASIPPDSVTLRTCGANSRPKKVVQADDAMSKHLQAGAGHETGRNIPSTGIRSIQARSM